MIGVLFESLVYGWEWTPSSVHFYVDGVRIRTVRYVEPRIEQNIWLTSVAWNRGVGIQGDTSIQYDYFRYYSKTYPEEVFVDNGEPGYFEGGTGWITSGLKGYGESSTRTSNVTGAYAHWTLDVATAGMYRVYVYKVFNANSDPNAKIDIVHGDVTNTFYVNYASGSSDWVDLGVFYFPAGTSDYIRNTVNTTGRYGRADAVRLIKE